MKKEKEPTLLIIVISILVIVCLALSEILFGMLI